MSQENPLEFKGGSLQTINALLRSGDPQALAAALHSMSGGATDFFGGEPLILDLAQATDLPPDIDWPAILALLRRYQLQPVGVRGHAAHGIDPATIGVAGIEEHFFGRSRPAPAPPPVPAAQPMPEPPATPPEPAAEPVQAELGLAAESPAQAAPPEPAPRTLIVDKPLRSGQRVYARGGDLVVLAMVSAGAEVIADGNIHVYAPLRGRALAGATGDTGARIFTTSMQAELVSIAGIYRTFEPGIPASVAGLPAMVGLVDENGAPTLRLEPLAIR